MITLIIITLIVLALGEVLLAASPAVPKGWDSVEADPKPSIGESIMLEWEVTVCYEFGYPTHRTFTGPKANAEAWEYAEGYMRPESNVPLPGVVKVIVALVPVN